MEELLKRSDVMKLLGVSRQTVINYVNSGKLKQLRVGVKLVRYRLEDVQKLLNKGE